jgi:hypothetical protein
MQSRNRLGRPARNPEQPISRLIGVGMSEADLALARQLAANDGRLARH